MSGRAVAAGVAALALGAASLAVGTTRAGFNSPADNQGNAYAVAPDFVAPNAERHTLADPSNGPGYGLRQCRFYQAYAEVADTGNPASGVASVQADLTAVSGGSEPTALGAGAFSVGGTTYNYGSLPRVATAAPGTILYSLLLADNAGNSRQEGDFSAVLEAGPGALAAVFLTGVEQGAASATAPGAFTTVTGSGVSADAATVRHGAYSLRTAPANAAAHASVTLTGTGNTVVARFAVRLASLPAATVNLFQVVPSAGNSAFLAYNSASGRLGVRWGTGAVVNGTVTPAAGVWYVVEMRVVTTNPRTIEWRLGSLDQPPASSAETAANVTSIRWGTTATNVTYTANFDDIVASRTSAHYPIGNGKVLSLAPSGMGTHLNPTRFQNNDNTAIDANSWTRVDEIPATSTADYVKQITTGNTSYVEFAFADTAETCINAVGAVIAYHSSVAGTNSGKTSIFNGSTENVVYSGSMGTAGLTYRRAIVSAGAGAWTTALVNALVARVGYSSDVSPVPYWDALLLEYDVPIDF
jgi:hypothetical protein